VSERVAPPCVERSSTGDRQDGADRLGVDEPNRHFDRSSSSWATLGGAFFKISFARVDSKCRVPQMLPLIGCEAVALTSVPLRQPHPRQRASTVRPKFSSTERLSPTGKGCLVGVIQAQADGAFM
jgi:hypothetical protein